MMNMFLPKLFAVTSYMMNMFLPKFYAGYQLYDEHVFAKALCGLLVIWWTCFCQNFTWLLVIWWTCFCQNFTWLLVIWWTCFYFSDCWFESLAGLEGHHSSCKWNMWPLSSLKSWATKQTFSSEQNIIFSFFWLGPFITLLGPLIFWTFFQRQLSHWGLHRGYLHI